MLRSPLRASRWLATLLVFCLIAGTLVFEPQARAATDLTLGADAEVADAQGDNVNLRDAPSYTGSVLTSVPEGWLVNVLDGPFTDDLDGTIWYQVVARGQTGYMLSDYLRSPDGAVSPAAAATTTANVNLRSGAGTNFAVLLVIPNGATVQTTGSVQNGFTQLTYNGITGWSASQYISTSSGATTATVIDGALNLRSAPNTSASVVTVMPNGATVTITGALTNGFYPVRYGTLSGYAFAAYLQIGSNPTPTPTTPASQTATVIDGSLNLRSGPGTSYLGHSGHAGRLHRHHHRRVAKRLLPGPVRNHQRVRLGDLSTNRRHAQLADAYRHRSGHRHRYGDRWVTQSALGTGHQLRRAGTDAKRRDGEHHRQPDERLLPGPLQRHQRIRLGNLSSARFTTDGHSHAHHPHRPAHRGRLDHRECQSALRTGHQLRLVDWWCRMALRSR